MYRPWTNVCPQARTTWQQYCTRRQYCTDVPCHGCGTTSWPGGDSLDPVLTRCVPCLLRLFRWSGTPQQTIWDVAVNPAWQRLGLGRALMERLTAKLVEDGIPTITLYAEPQVGTVLRWGCTAWCVRCTVGCRCGARMCGHCAASSLGPPCVLWVGTSASTDAKTSGGRHSHHYPVCRRWGCAVCAGSAPCGVCAALLRCSVARRCTVLSCALGWAGLGCLACFGWTAGASAGTGTDAVQLGSKVRVGMGPWGRCPGVGAGARGPGGPAPVPLTLRAMPRHVQ